MIYLGEYLQLAADQYIIIQAWNTSDNLSLCRGVSVKLLGFSAIRVEF